MKIRTRLTWLYTLISGSLLLLFASWIYLSAKKDREYEFFSLLEKEAMTKMNLLLYGEVDALSLQTIYRNNRQFLSEVEVAVYNNHDSLIYHDAVDIDIVKETPELLARIREEGLVSFFQQQSQVVGMRLEYEGVLYCVTAAAFDAYGNKKIYLLRNTLLLGWMLSVILSALAGYFFSKKAFSPVIQLRKRADTLSESNLHVRLPQLQPQDEIADLALSFNTLLDRLENSFTAQKHWVSTLSHELRTPLTTLHAELELALNKDKSQVNFEKVILAAKKDTHALIRLANSLLDLAKASYDPSQINKEPMRLDELLWETQAQVKRAYPHYRIDLHFDESAQEHEMWVFGNLYLLQTAFSNVIDNACKYSPENTCKLSVSLHKQTFIVRCTNTYSSAMKESDCEEWFKPFYRAPVAMDIDGSGIGLYLTRKILQQHHAQIDPEMLADRTICMKIILPYLPSTEE